MQIRTPLLAIATAIALLTATGCAVTRGQETVGAYVDDGVSGVKMVKNEITIRP